MRHDGGADCGDPRGAADVIERRAVGLREVVDDERWQRAQRGQRYRMGVRDRDCAHRECLVVAIAVGAKARRARDEHGAR